MRRPLLQNLRRQERRVRFAVGAQNPVPEKSSHREIAVNAAMVDEMQPLLVPEPGEAPEHGMLHVIFLVEKDMGVEGQGAGDRLNHEEIKGGRNQVQMSTGHTGRMK